MFGELLPELMKIVVEFSDKKLKQWTIISMLNRHWREIFLSLLIPENELYVKSLFMKEQIPTVKEKMTVHEFLRDNQYRGKQALAIASFHPIYCRILGLEEWVSSLEEFKLNTNHWYSGKLCMNDYAVSMYTYHDEIMKHFPKFSLQEKLSFLSTIHEFDQLSSGLDGAVAHPVTGSSEIGYIYTYKKPKRKDRDLFIMTKRDKKKIYLNGLSSVFDSRRIKKNAKLYHIKSKQHDWSKRELGSSGGYCRGMELIELFKPHLLKCRPVLESLEKFRGLHSRR